MLVAMSAAISTLRPTNPPPVAIGERCQRSIRFDRASIAAFAHLTGDANPLHFDAGAAERSRHGRVIAAGQQTTSQLIGLAATYFSRGHGAAREEDNELRELLCLNFNFALKHPVFADDEVELSWVVASAEWSGRLQGWLVQADGAVTSGERQCVVARATLLIKAFEDNR
jgi:acyl dehydratase